MSGLRGGKQSDIGELLSEIMKNIQSQLYQHYMYKSVNLWHNQSSMQVLSKSSKVVKTA